MRYLFVTYDFDFSKYHLMPWRTIFEVNKHLCKIGNKGLVVSLGKSKKRIQSSQKDCSAVKIRKGYQYFKKDLSDIFEQISPDLIIWPVAWREPILRMHILKSFNIPLLGYFPGGVYSLKASLMALNKIGTKKAYPYFFESICQSARSLNFLKKCGFKRLIALTELTRKKAISDLWQKEKIDYIPPGKDDDPNQSFGRSFGGIIPDILLSNPYYLFMGPPTRIRGIYDLLKAFDQTAEKLSNVHLVCLFRSDPGLQKGDIEFFIKNLKHNDRIITVWESLKKTELNAVIRQCYALVLPFLLIPSEIPLTIIEAAAWQKPIITTKSGGTAEFVRPFGTVVRPGDEYGLAKAMIEFVNNKSLYNQKSKNASLTYKSHPSWEEVSTKWQNAAQKTINS